MDCKKCRGAGGGTDCGCRAGDPRCDHADIVCDECKGLGFYTCTTCGVAPIWLGDSDHRGPHEDCVECFFAHCAAETAEENARAVMR